MLDFGGAASQRFIIFKKNKKTKVFVPQNIEYLGQAPWVRCFSYYCDNVKCILTQSILYLSDLYNFQTVDFPFA